MTTKLTDSIRLEDGTITTIDAMDKAGLIEFRQTKLHSPRAAKGYVIAYFADIKGTSRGWRISEYAYLSRISQICRRSSDAT